MALDNYRDLSTGGSDFGAGFQYEFFCTRCGRKWKSPFQPYRMGQVAGLLSRFSFLIPNMRTATRTTGNFAEMGSRGARDKAFEKAREEAQKLYVECGGCKQGVCMDCFDERADTCLGCQDREREQAEADKRRQVLASEDAPATGAACPNCRTAMAGGRFCPECGFDMASTHKSCPACAALIPRASRFCTDCGHGF